MNLIVAYIKRLFEPLRKFFGNPESMRKLAHYANVVSDLVRFALPVVNLIATLTPSKADDAVLAVVNRFMVPVDLDLSKPLSSTTKEALLMKAASAALRGEIEDAIEATGGAGLLLGGEYFKTIEAVPQHLIDTAVQNAYTAFKAGIVIPAAR